MLKDLNIFKILSIAFVILLIVLIIYCYLRFYPIITANNINYDRDTNVKIVQVLNQMLKIYYGRYNINILEEIVSEELLERIKMEFL